MRIAWQQKCNIASQELSYNSFLGAMLKSDQVAISTRTLICRQLLDQQKPKEEELGVPQEVRDIVPPLVKVMGGDNLSLTACATAALVNLSHNSFPTKNFLISQGVVRYCTQQLRQKDEELTLYSLYLLVNLTKTPDHRSIVVSYGGVPLLVDILTSSYQNSRKHKILAEVASILGQLCNEKDVRDQIGEYKSGAVVQCLLWVFETAPLNSKLKSKLLFVLRQLCADVTNKSKIGQHVISKVLDELGMTRPNNPLSEECAIHALLLLQRLADISSNAIQMGPRLQDAFHQCGLKKNGQIHGKQFSSSLKNKAQDLEQLIRNAEAKGETHQ